MPTPNLFRIATKELSQDAFLTWLLKWADPQHQAADPDLHECAQNFVRLLLGVGSEFVISSVRASRQWHNIDIKAEINNEHLLIIEDKKHAHEHGNQLDKYRKIAESWCESPERGKPWQLTCIYLKTGYESANILREIGKRKFRPVERQELMQRFKQYGHVSNAIFRDFVSYLAALDEAVAGFNTKPWNEWNNDDWIGFYQWLETQSDIEKVKWLSVDARSGRFWVFLLKWLDSKKQCSLFLQTESNNARICLKMTVEHKEATWPEKRGKSELRNGYMHYVLSKAREAKLPDIVKPARLGHGAYMTVAVVNPENWLGPRNQPIDKEAVKAKLRLYTEFTKQCQREWPLAPAGTGIADADTPSEHGPRTW